MANSAPSGGSLAYERSHYPALPTVAAGNRLYKLLAQGWRDPEGHLPLRYTYSELHSYDQDAVMLRGPTPLDSIMVRDSMPRVIHMKAAPKASHHAPIALQTPLWQPLQSARLAVEVSDSYGAASSVTVPLENVEEDVSVGFDSQEMLEALRKGVQEEHDKAAYEGHEMDQHAYHACDAALVMLLNAAEAGRARSLARGGVAFLEGLVDTCGGARWGARVGNVGRLLSKMGAGGAQARLALADQHLQLAILQRLVSGLAKEHSSSIAVPAARTLFRSISSLLGASALDCRVDGVGQGVRTLVSSLVDVLAGLHSLDQDTAPFVIATPHLCERPNPHAKLMSQDPTCIAVY
jgi:hypothetical protein